MGTQNNTSFSLRFLAESLNGEIVNAASDDLVCTSVVCSSQHQAAGSVFVALPGTKVDGHDYIDEAVRSGSIAVVAKDRKKLGEFPGIIVADTNRSLSRLSSLFAGEPSRALRVVGITGTNGKTTIQWLLYHLLNLLGDGCIGIGTLGVKAEGLFDDPSLTTPDPIRLHKYLQNAHLAGLTNAVMEVSSHGLAQCRAHDIAFDVAVFTNLTRDHLDYHNNMEAYFEAKQILFQLLAESDKPRKTAVVNRDSEFGRRIISNLRKWGLSDLSFGESKDAVVQIGNFEQNFEGSRVVLNYQNKEFTVSVPLIGLHNAQNVAAVFAVSIALGYKPEQVLPLLEKIPPVPGRLEPVGREDFGVYVDYAHTPDALENVLCTLRSLVLNELWVVFGCGGDRDRGKRSQMADIADKFADKVVVTSDNPRTEDPDQIIADILSSGCKAVMVEPDRRQAIERTLGCVSRGDVVLIAGKGHEDYQILGTKKVHFSDQEEVRRVLGS
jgi:UDP-N-acetylmuramoyl-L-alanyl-D-glutamate--2,6-diaminopimelate ligase